LLIDNPDWRISNLLQFVAIERMFHNGQLTFIQIGAYDGVVADDLRQVIETGNARGILIEPQAVPFACLEERFRGNPDITLVNAAIDRETGTRTFYSTRGNSSTVASFNRKHVLSHGVDRKDVIEYEVNCLTIEDVLQQANLERLDLLQIDAEGYDYEIIKSIDFDRLSPAIVRFEIFHLSQRDSDECLRMLAGHGYRFIFEGRDVLAVLESSRKEASPVNRSAA